MTARTVSSTSDERVVNNIMRHNYRVLEPHEKESMQSVKDLGLLFVELLHKIGGTDQHDGHQPPDLADRRMASRELSLAQTKIEEAVMWATKHITR